MNVLGEHSGKNTVFILLDIHAFLAIVIQMNTLNSQKHQRQCGVNYKRKSCCVDYSELVA